jgi:hypothetical protein
MVLCKREESAHGVVSLLGARSAAPSRFTVYALTRKAEAETTTAVGVVVSASFRCLSVSERVSVSAKRYHDHATRCKPTTAEGVCVLAMSCRRTRSP